MSISTKEFPKEAIFIWQNYINIRAQQTDSLRQKIETTFDALRVIKQNISTSKGQIPIIKQTLFTTQKTWLGWVVSQLNGNNCLLNTIARVFCHVFPAFKIELDKQKEMQKSIDALQEHRALKIQKMNELKLLQKELKHPTAFSNQEFLTTLLEHSIHPVPFLQNYKGDIEDLSISNIHAPIVSGIAWNGDGGRHFCTIIAKASDQTFCGFIFYQRYLQSDIISDQLEGINWTTKHLPGLKPYQLPETKLVVDGFVQKKIYDFLTNLIQKGKALWIFEKDGESWFTSYTLATSEEVINLHRSFVS